MVVGGFKWFLVLVTTLSSTLLMLEFFDWLFFSVTVGISLRRTLRPDKIIGKRIC